MLSLQPETMPGQVVQACNANFLGGRDQACLGIRGNPVSKISKPKMSEVGSHGTVPA
jgi:hypothetical protein